jgi:WD40 repeat protein
LESLSLKPIQKYTAPDYDATSFYTKMDLSKCGKWLVSGSKNNMAYIWKIGDPICQLELEGHTSEVSCVAFSKFDLKVTWILLGK